MKAVPESEWKRLGIGYAPISGQVFPEACAFELSDLGPQCEPLWRYSEDQPRDPNGEFASGGGGGDTGRWSVSDEHAEFNETNKSRLESGEYKIMKVPASKVSVDSTYPDRVSLYAEQMKGGEKFPMPVGRSNDGGKTFWSPNGNHRIAAAKSLGDEHIYLMVKKSDLSDRSSRFSERYSPDQSRDPDGKFGSSTVGGAVSINDKEFEHQQVLSSHMQEALKNGSVESYSAFKAASDSMKNNMASTNLTDRAKDDAINNLKEHVKAAEKYGDKNAAAAFNAGIESLSR
jgi:hypothetical protein